MHLTAMDIKDTPPFTELVELDFDERVNLFIGPNASGKSTILKEMDAAFNGDKRPASSFLFNDPEPRYQYQTPFVSAASRREHQNWSRTLDHYQILIFMGEDPDDPDSATYDNSRPPVIYIGPVRPALPELYDEEAADEAEADIDVDEEVKVALDMPFSGANFSIVNEKMYEKADTMFDHEQSNDIPGNERRAYRVYQVSGLVHSCVKEICAEVLTEIAPRNYVTGLNVEDLDLQPRVNFNSVNIHPALGINTIDRPNFIGIRPEDRPTYSERLGPAPLYAGFLSSGTQSTFLWIHWLAYRMLNHYEFTEGWMNQPAILLIDEIENHLHPTWQRRVIPALLEHFPGLQIFATTHSPFVVAGLRAGQVHLLDRNSEGVVTAATTEQDIIGWTTDEILRSFMGVAEPTDELTIQRTKRLRELRRKESLSDEEGEELETLRRQVNADILSSRSSLELQDERYADMMMRFIEARQNELSQDNR